MLFNFNNDAVLFEVVWEDMLRLFFKLEIETLFAIWMTTENVIELETTFLCDYVFTCYTPGKNDMYCCNVIDFCCFLYFS